MVCIRVRPPLDPRDLQQPGAYAKIYHYSDVCVVSLCGCLVFSALAFLPIFDLSYRQNMQTWRIMQTLDLIFDHLSECEAHGFQIWEIE